MNRRNGNESGKEPLPIIYTNSRVIPRLGARAYFRALAKTLDGIGCGSTPEENEGHFIYVAGWLLNLVDPELPFYLKTQAGMVPFIDLLKAKARAGVDVRVLGWVSWSLGMFGRLDVRYENLANIESIRALRQEPALAQKCTLNIIGHPAGAAHAKLIVAGTPEKATGFTGGIDLSADRARPVWVDVHAQVEGPAVQGLYDLFRDMWNQVLAFQSEQPAVLTGDPGSPASVSNFTYMRPARFETEAGEVTVVEPGTPQTPDRSFAHLRAGRQQVQSLRTLPQFNFTEEALPVLRVAPLTFAPQGSFEIREALSSAIESAEKYIYIEDQYFWSVEAMQWLNAALLNRPQLKVILITGDYQMDDPPLPPQMPVALREGLAPGLTRQALRRVAVFRRRGFVHAKTTLIDDRWALIGSANLARRSFYTDVEHSVAIVDPQASWVPEYRATLWSRHLQRSKAENGWLADLDHALGLWDPSWGAGSPGDSLPSHFERLDLGALPTPEIGADLYDLVADPDSRQPWYFPLEMLNQ